MQRLLLSLRIWFIDHWYGRLSLAETFWINCFFVNLGAGIILRRFMLGSGGVTFLALVSLPISLWQLVGLWRSARRNRLEQPFWSAVVRGLCILNVVAFILITANALLGGLGMFSNMPFNMPSNMPSSIPSTPSPSPDINLPATVGEGSI